MSNIGWVVVTPYGRPLWHTAEKLRIDAINEHVLRERGNWRWRNWYSQGYRCKKVMVIDG